MQGFLILNCIIGGQTLASVSDGHLDDTLGIVIIGVISLVVSRRHVDYERPLVLFHHSGHLLRLSSDPLVLPFFPNHLSVQPDVLTILLGMRRLRGFRVSSLLLWCLASEAST